MKKIFGILAVSLYASYAFGDVVDSIEFEGLDRVDESVLADCLTIKPHQNYTSEDVDELIKSLFNKGFFSDIKIVKSGTKLLIKCVEKLLLCLCCTS